ncbi:MAG: hypothetical protein JST26_17370 [Bacteroidetes bacterium]|nr:hypothetical protein [Bacteroidota bacterium]
MYKKLLRYSVLPLTMFVAVLCLDACKKEKAPANPYDSVDYSNHSPAETSLDPNSIQGIHKNILSVKCANPGCHDGHFEPDFRTIQSSYATMVWAKLKKNDSLGTFKYRVIPGNYTASWFHERLVTTNQTLGRMPLYANPLSSSELQNIETWISNGARDMFGNSPAFPNNEPLVNGYIALNSTYTVRFDTTRESNVYYNSFLVQNGQTVNIVVGVTDDSTATGNLIHNKLKLSLDKNDFTTAPLGTYNGTAITASGVTYWMFTFSTSALPQNQIIFMRYYTNDGSHSNDTQFPTDNLQYEYKTYWSFKVTP